MAKTHSWQKHAPSGQMPILVDVTNAGPVTDLGCRKPAADNFERGLMHSAMVTFPNDAFHHDTVGANEARTAPRLIVRSYRATAGIRHICKDPRVLELKYWL